MMKKRILSSCTLFLVLGFAIAPTSASAQETPGLEGVWFAHITPVDCQTGNVIPNAPSFRGLNMFSHDGSMTNDAAFPVPTLLRSSGLGTWQHTQAQTYTLAFRFFRYNALMDRLRQSPHPGLPRPWWSMVTSTPAWTTSRTLI